MPNMKLYYQGKREAKCGACGVIIPTNEARYWDFDERRSFCALCGKERMNGVPGQGHLSVNGGGVTKTAQETQTGPQPSKPESNQAAPSLQSVITRQERITDLIHEYADITEMVKKQTNFTDEMAIARAVNMIIMEASKRN